MCLCNMHECVCPSACNDPLLGVKEGTIVTGYHCCGPCLETVDMIQEKGVRRGSEYEKCGRTVVKVRYEVK